MGNGDLGGLETTRGAWPMTRDFGAGFNSPGTARSWHPWVPPLRVRGAGCRGRPQHQADKEPCVERNASLPRC